MTNFFIFSKELNALLAIFLTYFVILELFDHIFVSNSSGYRFENSDTLKSKDHAGAIVTELTLTIWAQNIDEILETVNELYGHV